MSYKTNTIFKKQLKNKDYGIICKSRQRLGKEHE